MTKPLRVQWYAYSTQVVMLPYDAVARILTQTDTTCTTTTWTPVYSAITPITTFTTCAGPDGPKLDPRPG